MGGLRHAAVGDQAHVAGGAAHVEAQHVLLARQPRQLERAAHAAGRAGECGERRVRGRPLGVCQAARGLHHRGPRQPQRVSLVPQPTQVGAQQGGERGIHLGGGGALVLAERAHQLVRERDVYIRQPLGEQLPEQALVLGVGVGVQQHHRHRFDARLSGRCCPLHRHFLLVPRLREPLHRHCLRFPPRLHEPLQQLLCLGEIERPQRPVGRHPLRRRETQLRGTSGAGPDSHRR